MLGRSSGRLPTCVTLGKSLKLSGWALLLSPGKWTGEYPPHETVVRMRRPNARKVLIVQRRDAVGHTVGRGEPQSFTYRPPSPGSSLPEVRTSDCLLERRWVRGTGRISPPCGAGRAGMTHSLVYTVSLTCFQKDFEVAPN